jgi:hypothetical protein
MQREAARPAARCTPDVKDPGRPAWKLEYPGKIVAPVARDDATAPDLDVGNAAYSDQIKLCKR